MKSAYELAMDRLNKVAPSVTLTAEQKRRIAELERLLVVERKKLQDRLEDQKEKVRLGKG